VTAKAIDPNMRVLIEWPGYTGPTEVEWTFQAITDGTTFVRVQESDYFGANHNPGNGKGGRWSTPSAVF